MQQTKKGLHDPDYKLILERIDISQSLVDNSDAKKILQPTQSKTIVRPKIKTPGKTSKKQRLDDKQVKEDSQAEEISTRGILSDSKKLKLEKLYTKGPEAYGSVSNLQKVSSLSRVKVEFFIQSKNSHTKYRQYRRRFPRLKVIAYDINEIWSIDLAYVDKLTKYNNGVEYILVAVDVLSRKLNQCELRVQRQLLKLLLA